jgi:hypothetical protein
MDITETEWILDVAGTALRLVGPAAWVGPLARTWTVWEGKAPAWEAGLVPAPDLPVPRGPLFGVRPRFTNGRCLLEAKGFFGEVAADGEWARMRAHPAAKVADLEYFVRVAFAVCAFHSGAILFHAAGIVRRGAAFALFGHSGSGKTTAARLSTGLPVLSDDLILLRLGEAGWEVWASPFGRRRVPEVRSAPLGGLFRLEQGPEDRLEPLSLGVALGELVANSPVINADPGRSLALLARWEEILKSVPIALLKFRKSDTFWEIIDGGSGPRQRVDARFGSDLSRSR